MIYLNRFYLPEEKEYDGRQSVYPFNVFSDKNLQEIEFDNITIFYGSNGLGKSTLINIIIKKFNKKQEVIKATRVKTNEIERPKYENFRNINIDGFVDFCKS